MSVREAVIQFRTSVKVTAPLVKLVLQQSRVYPAEAMAELSKIKSQIRQEIQSELASSEVSVFESLPNPLKKAKELVNEKGTTSWLTAPCITDHGFRLHIREPSAMPSATGAPHISHQAVCAAHLFKWITHSAATTVVSHP